MNFDFPTQSIDDMISDSLSLRVRASRLGGKKQNKKTIKKYQKKNEKTIKKYRKKNKKTIKKYRKNKKIMKNYRKNK